MCDIYDKLMKETIDEENESLEGVISGMQYLGKNGEIDEDMLMLLIDNIILYPINTQVFLSTGQIAEVKKCFVGDKYNIYKPIVWTITPPRRSIDLREETNITIKCIIGKKNKVLMKQQIRSGTISAINGKKPEGGEYR